jgi:hypothetical protein
MEQMLHGADNSSPYIDDILVYRKQFTAHYKHLKEVFTRLRKAKLKVKTSKCKIGFKETKFLGFIIDEHGIRADLENTAPIKDYPRPKTPKAVSLKTATSNS